MAPDQFPGIPALDAAAPYLWLVLVLLALVFGVTLWLVLRRTRRRERMLAEYQAVFEGAPEPILILDHDLSVLDANEGAAAMLGQPVARIKRSRLINWFAPDGGEDVLKQVSKQLTSKGTTSFWATVQTGQEGKSVDIRLRRPTSGSDVGTATVALVYDITEYREEGRLFKTLHEKMLAHMPIEVNVLSPQGEYLHISPSTMGSRELHEWAIGKTDVEFCQRLGLHPEIALRRRAYRRQAANSGKPISFDEELVLPDGERKFFHRTFLPVTQEKSIYAVISYGVDRTELRLRKDEASQARVQAGETERLREALMANLSHEFRTPLTGILGAAQILSYEVSEQGQELVEMIERSGRRLMNTLNSLLDLAGLKEGAPDVHPRVLDLGHEVESAAASFRDQAESKGMFLRWKLPEQHVWVRLDQGHLFRVLQHLISNAVKFTEEGGIVLEVEQAGHDAVVRIMDTGVGIEDEYLKKLFDEFDQESLGVAREFEGVGVGLAVTRALVERMGGTVSVESQKGEGSMFTLTFPTAFSTERDGGLERARVLLIEPSDEDRQTADYALRPVVNMNAEQRLEALERYAGVPFDVLLISIAGPEVDLKDLLESARKVKGFGDVPVVALDGYPLPGNREAYLSAGFAEYVPKPLNRQVLLDAVSAVCAETKR